MTAVVRAERATRTWLTGGTGLLIVAAAFAMMAWAAPSPAHARPQHGTTPATSVASVTSVKAQLESQVWARPAVEPGSPAVRTRSAARP
jgi:hypothetical protein